MIKLNKFVLCFVECFVECEKDLGKKVNDDIRLDVISKLYNEYEDSKGIIEDDIDELSFYEGMYDYCERFISNELDNSMYYNIE